MRGKVAESQSFSSKSARRKTGAPVKTHVPNEGLGWSGYFGGAAGAGERLARGRLARGFEASGHQELGQLGAGSDELDFDGGEAAVAEAEGFGGGMGKVDHTALGNGTAVIDGDDDGAVVPQICDAEHRTERQSAMGAGELVLVVGFPAGGSATLEELAIPGGDAELIPVVVADDDLGVEALGWGSSLRAGDTENGGKNSAGKSKETSRTVAVI